MMEVRPTTLIDHINSPADLRALKPEQLPQVCRELRRYILEVLSVTPGHLGSSLGAYNPNTLSNQGKLAYLIG